MAEFKYKAKDPAGRVRTGSLSASSKSIARSQLARMRLRPIMLKATKLDSQKSDGLLGKFIYRDDKGRIQIQIGEQQPTTKDIIVFSKQFATMIGSGVPLIQSLGILASQQRVRSFGKLLENIQHAVENGSKLSDAMEAYPKIFDSLYVSMVRAGEASGNLDQILLKLTTYVEKAAKIKSQVKSAMMYPAIVMVVAVVVIAGLLIWVVPSFAQQFEGSGKELPSVTLFVVNLSNMLVQSWYMILGGMILGAFVFKALIQTEPGRKIFDQQILRIPGIGDLLRKIAVGRFCSTMSTMLSSGVNLLEALTICAAASGNKTIEAFIMNVRAHIEQGRRISDPLGEGGLFPPMVVSMVAVGESTGALDEMLTKVSEFYEEEVDLAVKTVLSMIEPIMIVFIGSAVGFIVIAMYLPIFDLAGTV